MPIMRKIDAEEYETSEVEHETSQRTIIQAEYDEYARQIRKYGWSAVELDNDLADCEDQKERITRITTIKNRLRAAGARIGAYFKLGRVNGDAFIAIVVRNPDEDEYAEHIADANE